MLRWTLLFLPLVSCYYTPPSVEAPATIDLTALFQHKTSRNQRVITQAMEIVVAMQTAPTCSRMAASHLMNECKLLEHAPEFAKARPEAYLDNVKTEFAAKLAVCELLSAQPHNPSPPSHCGILVPSTSACAKSGVWWYSRHENTLPEKQCYPEYKDQQYSQCLKTLQSSPQYWTSFSNARQNAVVMCQASRDAVERENHLETFKNLTQVMGVISDTLKSSLEEYTATMSGQKASMEEFRATQARLKDDAQAVYENAISNMGILDNKFHDFMEHSIGQLVSALAKDQNHEMAKLRQQFQGFSADLATQSSDIVQQFNSRLRIQHELALSSLRANHEAQVNSYNVLSSRLDHIHDTAMRTSSVANSSFDQISAIEKRLSDLSDQTDTIVDGLAMFSTWSIVLLSLIRNCTVAMALLAIIVAACRLNTKLAACVIFASSASFIICQLGQEFGPMSTRIATFLIDGGSLAVSSKNLAAIFNAAGKLSICLIVAYLIWYTFSHLVLWFTAASNNLLASHWLSQHGNEAGIGILPSIEIPRFATSKTDNYTPHAE